MLYHLLYPFSEYISALNVIKYISFRIIMATLTSMLISFILSPYMIRKLAKRQISQNIRDDGPQSHLKKQGTPTMGGVMILACILIASLLWAHLDNLYIWLVLGGIFFLGMLGFIDDYLKLFQKYPKGIGSKNKLIWQLAVSTIIAFVLYFTDFNTQLVFPFFKDVMPDIGFLFIILSILVIVGSSNAVNLTDGLDGLAIGPVMMSSLTLLVFSYVAGHLYFSEYLNVLYVSGAGELSIVCGAIFGAGIGFLWYNSYPAQVFMGDVGSLALGGGLGIIAIITKNELLLALIGGVFVMETLSVIIQVLSFKLTGKRVFLMAPIHHHFELKGWPEPKVIVRFWIISVILSLLAFSTLKLR